MFNNLRLSSAQQFVLHTALSIGIGALAAGVTAGAQAVTTSFDVHTVWAASLAGFSAWFAHGFLSLRGNPQTAQAVSDTEAQILPAIQDIYQQLAALANHTHPVTPQPVRTPTPPPVPQQAFPATTSTSTQWNNVPYTAPSLPVMPPQ